MTENYVSAEKKLREEEKNGTFDKCGRVMKGAVKDALLDFCRQNDEFAAAIIQGGSFVDCMKEVGKGIKNSVISDIDAYKRAAAFYFPGSTIEVHMDIRLSEYDIEQEQTAAPIVIDLGDFL